MAERKSKEKTGLSGKNKSKDRMGASGKNKSKGRTGSTGKNKRTPTKNKERNSEGNKRGGIGILVICLILITAAVFGGYALANNIRNGSKGTGNGLGKNTNENIDGSDKNGNGSGLNGDKNGNAGRTTPVLSKTPVEVIFDVNFETGRIEEILIGILRTTEGKLDYLRIDTDVMYTMSTGLYTSLTPDNTTLPQMVTFSELYRYYHNDRAFEAGRSIISEMLNFNILYYSAMPDYDFEKLFYIKKYDEEIDMKFAVTSSEAKEDYETAGSVKGFVGKILKDTITNWSIEERLRYLDALDGLEPGNVTFTDAPVYEMNESCRLDADATGRILYDILY
ncbi:MAG: hypothetical protein K6E85_13730 [Lachnospiraceae bacterium]|nr:hypothetical protein [Lachnospiraceae bacterium]